MLLRAFRHTQILLACSRCTRRGQYAKDRFNPDMSMAALLIRLTVHCPNAGLVGDRQCGAYFPQIGKRSLETPFRGFKSSDE
jgi:hypothetical protein